MKRNTHAFIGPEPVIYLPGAAVVPSTPKRRSCPPFSVGRSGVRPVLRPISSMHVCTLRQRRPSGAHRRGADANRTKKNRQPKKQQKRGRADQWTVHEADAGAYIPPSRPLIVHRHRRPIHEGPVQMHPANHLVARRPSSPSSYRSTLTMLLPAQCPSYKIVHRHHPPLESRPRKSSQTSRPSPPPFSHSPACYPHRPSVFGVCSPRISGSTSPSHTRTPP